ncbi:MAG: sensor histidine kinase [Streptosporangiaceae bacterium]
MIHLVAELAENATIFSPPNTPVRILGDTVGRGFAIEIEDRGLGISPEQLAVINRDLADPPEFDLSGSDRLGLFVAARLAQRHDIKISLRPSVYGGTTAIVVIPLALVARPEAAGIGRGSAARELPSRLARRPTALGPGSAPGPALSFTAPDNAAALTGAAVTVAVPAPEGAAGDDPRAAEPDPKMTTAGLIELGLPVRVRQESLAPRLREQAGPAGQGNGAAGPAGGAARAAADRSPEVARSTMAALQRGWELGRATAVLPQAAPTDGPRTGDLTAGEDPADDLPTEGPRTSDLTADDRAAGERAGRERATDTHDQ